MEGFAEERIEVSLIERKFLNLQETPAYAVLTTLLNRVSKWAPYCLLQAS